jgi:hypothetical protein
VHVQPEGLFDLLQLGTHALVHCVAQHHESPAPGLSTDVGEAQEVERFRFPHTLPLTLLSSKASELDQTRLFRMNLQTELSHSLFKSIQKLLRVLLVLEAHHDVIGVTHDNHVTVSMPTPPLVGPQVEDVVEVHICQERRYGRPLRRPNLTFRPLPVLQDSCRQPPPQQAQDSPVRDPVLKESNHPPMVDGVKETTDVCVEHPVHLLPDESRRQRVQRIVRAAPGSEAVGESQEVTLVDRI